MKPTMLLSMTVGVIAILHLELYYTENPLYINSHATIQLSRNRGLAFSNDGDTCYLEGRKIAFWHFQSDFLRYVNVVIVLHNIHYPFRFPNHLNGGISRKLSLGARRVYPMTRSEIYGSLKELNSEKWGRNPAPCASRIGKTSSGYLRSAHPASRTL